MMKNLWLMLALAAALVVLPACESETTPTDPVETKPVAPTALMATSLDADKIALKWTIADDTARKGYVITIKNMTTNQSNELTVADEASTNMSISGLTEGVVYSFTVRAINVTVESDPSPTIMWSPAKRVVTNLKLYETDSEQGSGIELPSRANLTVSAGDKWDICLDTRDESFDIGSPTISSYTDDSNPPKFVKNGLVARKTLLGKAWGNVTSLDEVYESVDLTSETLEESLYNFNAQNTAGAPFAFVVKTESGNFAKVLVKAVGGKLLQGTAPDRFVELEISYQSGANVPYAVTAKQDGPTWKKVNNSVIGEKKAQ